MKVYEITEFGAVPDGSTLCTKSIQDAIDACAAAGGGRVECPSGVFLTGSFWLRDNVTLHLESGCEIRGSGNPDDYEDFVSDGFHTERSPEGTALFLVGASHAANIAVTGFGKINASGLAFYDHLKMRADGAKFAEKPKRRPRLLMFHKCSNVRIEDASFVDSPCWTFWLMMCRDLTIRGIRITGDQRMINNDGIDIDACENVSISDCRIKTDDDCVVLRAIQAMYDEPAVCRNVAITNCVLESTCQCVRVSCPSDNVVRDCVLSNLTVKSRDNGINFDFPNRYLQEGGTCPVVENIMFSNLVIECGGHPIRIEAREGVKLQSVSGISFSNVRARGGACVVKGNSDSIVRNVSFNGMRLETNCAEAFQLGGCERVSFNDVEVSCAATE